MIMTSVFRKLISRELGESKYHKYFYIYQKKVMDKTYDYRNLNNEEIYNDIYEELKDIDIMQLRKRMERLSDAMYTALLISKNYIFTFIFFLVGALFLISLNLAFPITILGLVLMGISFIYKTYEFVVNKFCYIDAHIIIVYKSVLDELLEIRSNF